MLIGSGVLEFWHPNFAILHRLSWSPLQQWKHYHGTQWLHQLSILAWPRGAVFICVDEQLNNSLYDWECTEQLSHACYVVLYMQRAAWLITQGYALFWRFAFITQPCVAKWSGKLGLKIWNRWEINPVTCMLKVCTATNDKNGCSYLPSEKKSMSCSLLLPDWMSRESVRV